MLAGGAFLFLVLAAVVGLLVLTGPPEEPGQVSLTIRNFTDRAVVVERLLVDGQPTPRLAWRPAAVIEKRPDQRFEFFHDDVEALEAGAHTGHVSLRREDDGTSLTADFRFEVTLRHLCFVYIDIRPEGIEVSNCIYHILLYRGSPR